MSPKEVSVLDMMEARDRRAGLQRRMTAAFHVPVISFTMNIAGPVKRTPLIRRGFVLGLRTLRRRLKAAGFPVLHEELLDEFTGCEAFLAVDAGLLAIKALTSDIENSGPLGRLFDMDVISPAGEKAEREMLGLSGRTCLLCGRPAEEIRGCRGDPRRHPGTASGNALPGPGDPGSPGLTFPGTEPVSGRKRRPAGHLLSSALHEDRDSGLRGNLL